MLGGDEMGMEGLVCDCGDNLADGWLGGLAALGSTLVTTAKG